MSGILLEAESFENLGGWAVDTQSMEQVGSAYIMAHGMGMPVEDAETTCRIPKSGQWAVWARTRDWTAVWKRGKPAGIFKVAVNGKALPEVLGTNGEQWAWQKAGALRLKKGKTRIALRDLSGFNGRCDALYLTTDMQEAPPNSKDALAEFRRRVAKTVCKDDPIEYDLAVIGGGIAGICAAIAASRTGSNVILMQDRSVLGGCNSSEIRVVLGGFTHTDPYPKLGNVVEQISPVAGGFADSKKAELFEDARKKNVFEKTVFTPATDGQKRLALNERVIAVEKDKSDPQKILAVISRNVLTGVETRRKARFFADCTGDAAIARMMGAETMYGREPRARFGESLAPERGDRQVMGLSVLWRSEDAGGPSPFPDVDWGLSFNEDNACFVKGSDWDWETGQYRDQATETEYVRDYGMMAVYANWSYLKNHSKQKDKWANERLAWVSAFGGKRESYRVVGDYVLNQNDIEKRIAYPDATGSMTWNIDIHFPDPENEAKFKEPFRSCAYHRGILKPYPIPYRCLYARDVRNLFLGGRIISLSRIAFSCARVQRTLGVLGEVVGMAASVCKKENASPRDVYEKYFDQLKEMMEKGAPAPSYHNYPCDASESYHFADIGFVSVVNAADYAKQLEEPTLKRRIDALNVRHKYASL